MYIKTYKHNPNICFQASLILHSVSSVNSLAQAVWHKPFQRVRMPPPRRSLEQKVNEGLTGSNVGSWSQQYLEKLRKLTHGGVVSKNKAHDVYCCMYLLW